MMWMMGVSEKKEEDPQPGTSAGIDSNWGPLKGRFKAAHSLWLHRESTKVRSCLLTKTALLSV